MEGPDALGRDEGDAGGDGVGAPAQGAEHPPRVGGVAGLGELLGVEEDHGVRADHEGVGPETGDRAGLGLGEPLGGREGVGHGERLLVHVGREHLEGGDEAGEQRLPARGAAGEHDGAEHAPSEPSSKRGRGSSHTPPPQGRKPWTDAMTCWTASSERWAWMGRQSTSRHARSVSGREPPPPPNGAYGAWKCRGTG